MVENAQKKSTQNDENQIVKYNRKAFGNQKNYKKNSRK